MPTYVWKCKKCGRDTEVLKPIAQMEESPDSCEHCDYSVLERQFAGSTNFRLEGYGWFKDGYDGRDQKAYNKPRWWEET